MSLWGVYLQFNLFVHGGRKGMLWECLPLLWCANAVVWQFLHSHPVDALRMSDPVIHLHKDTRKTSSGLQSIRRLFLDRHVRYVNEYEHICFVPELSERFTGHLTETSCAHWNWDTNETPREWEVFALMRTDMKLARQRSRKNKTKHRDQQDTETVRAGTNTNNKKASWFRPRPLQF